MVLEKQMHPAGPPTPIVRRIAMDSPNPTVGKDNQGPDRCPSSLRPPGTVEHRRATVLRRHNNRHQEFFDQCSSPIKGVDGLVTKGDPNKLDVASKNSRNVTALPDSLNDFSFAVASSLEGTENLFANPEPTWCSLPPPIATVFVPPAAQNCDHAQIRNTVANAITRINT